MLKNSLVYNQKVKGCETLVNLKKKKITIADIASVASQVNLTKRQMKIAWDNFTQTGGKFVDKRVKECNPNHIDLNKVFSNYKQNEQKTSRKGKGFHGKTNDSKLARKILLEYMTTKKSIVEIADENKIHFYVVYDWIKELTVAGTICGEKIIDTKKYAKLPILDVMWLYKHPNTKRGSIAILSKGERTAYLRVADVLLKYL